MNRPSALPLHQTRPWQQLVIAVVLVAGLVALLNLTGSLAQVRNAIPGLSTSTPTYQTSTVSSGNVAISVTATGPVSAVTSIPLSFKQSGKLTELKVTVGDQVTTGQVLATLDTSDLQTALDQAKSTLAQAQANLTKVQAGPSSQAIAVAQTSVDNAKQSVADAQASLASTQATSAESLKVAQASVATAQTNLSSAQATVASTQDQATKAIASDQLAITNAQKSLDAEQATVAANVPVLENQISQAKNNLWAAQINRDAAGGRGPGPALDAGNASVAAAETAVNTAQAQLVLSQKQSAQQIASLQATLDSARAQLAKDQSSQQAAITAAQNQVKQAQAAVSAAQNSVGQAQAQAAASAQSAQSAIDNATNSVRSAQAAYSQTTAAPLQTDIDTAKAQVASAQAAVDAAQANLDSATLTAPFAGTIAAVNGSVGQWMSGGSVAATTGSSASATAIFTVMDLNNLQVVAQVNEADVSKVKVGDAVTFNVSAFPNQTFQGKVLSVQPVGTTTSNVVSYNVTSSIQVSKNASLYPGMTATVTIISAEHDNVLTVPDSALTFAQSAISQGLVPKPGATTSAARSSSAKSAATTSAAGSASATSAATSQSYLVTQSQGKLALVPVTAGLSDGSVTEIASGIKAGDAVVVSKSGGTTSTRSTTSTTRTTSPLSTGGPGGPGG
jgi:HlyD family secretion protein